MIRHNAPSDQFDAAKFRSPTHHLYKVITLFIFEKINAMRDTANKMMNRIMIFRTIIRICHLRVVYHILRK